LRLREEHLTLSLGLHAWDTVPLPELRAREARVLAELTRDQAWHRGVRGQRSGVQAELALFAHNSHRLVLYLRALCYLREHGIAPDWPQGSVTTGMPHQRHS
jgi:hypothetical protein